MNPTNKAIKSKLAIVFLSYQVKHPEENEEVRQCAKMLDKILEWDDAT